MGFLETIRSLAHDVFEHRAPEADAGRGAAFRFPKHVMVEPSYACNLSCTMCPRHADGVPQGQMKPEFFRERVLPALEHFEFVSFVGWGEPTVNRNLPEYLRLTKEKGCWTMFITNGLLLKDPMSLAILDARPDHIYFSIDASESETYEFVRGKGNFQKALESIHRFSELVRAHEHKPLLNWVFVMMRRNLDELPGAIERAADAGFNRVCAKHIECATERAGLREALWNTGLAPDLTAEDQAHYEAVVARAREAAERRGIDLLLFPQRYSVDGMCLAHPVDNVFVDWEGYVSPCCYLNRLDMMPYRREKAGDNGVLGTVAQVSLVELLQSPRYASFREEWREGRVPEPCRGCLNVARIHSTSGEGVPERLPTIPAATR